MTNTTHDITIESWDFWMPLEKSQTPDGKRWIKGIASTEDRDLQNEIVKKNGIDFRYFLKFGYFNYDHRPGAEYKVGEPTVCRVTSEGLYVEGFLYRQKQSADALWEHILSLEASGSSRKMGFSIQGKTRKRSGNVILQSWLQDIAVTPAPVNTHTWLDVMKSLSECTWCAHQGTSVCTSCGACQKSLEAADDDKDPQDEAKALSAGYGNPTVDGGASGSALRVQSLDSDKKCQTIEGREERRLSKGQVTAMIRDGMGYSEDLSRLYTDILFDLNQWRTRVPDQH